MGWENNVKRRASLIMRMWMLYVQTRDQHRSFGENKNTVAEWHHVYEGINQENHDLCKAFFESRRWRGSP
jgi:hypothetical protein